MSNKNNLTGQTQTTEQEETQKREEKFTNSLIKAEEIMENNEEKFSEEEIENIIKDFTEFYEWVKEQNNKWNYVALSNFENSDIWKIWWIAFFLKLSKKKAQEWNIDEAKKQFNNAINKVKKFSKKSYYGGKGNKLNLKDKLENSKKAYEYLSENFFVNNDEIIAIFSWEYCVTGIFLKWHDFRVFSLTSEHQPWFCDDNWRFCQGNVFKKAQQIVSNQDIPAFITYLWTLMTDASWFVRGAHWSKNGTIWFDEWVKFKDEMKKDEDKRDKNKISRSLNWIMKAFNSKTNQVKSTLNSLWFSNEALNYFDTFINEFNKSFWITIKKDN